MSKYVLGSPTSVIFDGYKIDLSAGATTNQVLQYNGTSFIAGTVSGGGGGGGSVADVSDFILGNTATNLVLTYSPSSQSNYAVYIYYRVITAATNLDGYVTWTDSSGPQSYEFINSTEGIGSFIVPAIYLDSYSGPINIYATAGTSSHVSFSASIASMTTGLPSSMNAYNTIQSNGSGTTQRTTINLAPRLVASDVASKTFIDLGTSGVAAGSYTSTNLTVDAYGRITTAANGVGGAASAWDMTTWISNASTTASNSGGISVFNAYQFISAATITGIKTYWAGPATTLKAAIWSDSGTVLTSNTMSVGGIGTYTISVSQSLSASTTYWFSIFDTSAANYTSNSISFQTLPALLGPTLILINNAYASGDVFYTNPLTDQWFACTPVFSI